MTDMVSGIEVDIPEPLRGCFLHCEVICVRDCCGIDAISQEHELVAEWGREAGPQAVSQAITQLEQLMAQVQDRSHDFVSMFLNACTVGEIGRAELLSFLQAFKVALAAISSMSQHATEGEELS
jgi:hypothetical protein